ncbi:ZNF208 [Branchiostoma lanceolatum]|uniref:ZNF208 protein n=1 Tax=Branchiostoma lanceolatum TaxID=7740 RepID=A0A8K0EKQ6_BRALA|nr:ZNF208 [Branchiostoma lanceolatum]
MEEQSSSTTVSSQPVSVDEMSSGDSAATQASDGGSECCGRSGDKNGAECETDNNGASTSCTSNVQDIKSRQDALVYVLQDVQSNKMVIQVPVIADESGVINCTESGLAESKDTPIVVGDTQTNCGTDCDSVNVVGSTEVESSTFDINECSSHVGLVTEEALSSQTITVLSNDTHNQTTITECNQGGLKESIRPPWCNSNFIPQVGLPQTTSFTKSSSRNPPQRDTEAQKEGSPVLHLLDAEVGGKRVSTSGLLSEMTTDEQRSQDEEKEEKNLEVAISALEGQVQTPHKLTATSSHQSVLFSPVSLQMLITDRKQQRQTNRGRQSGLLKKETNAVIRVGTTEVSEIQNVFDEGSYCAQPEEQQQIVSLDTNIVQSHNEKCTLGHAPKIPHERESNPESESVQDHTAYEGKNSDSELIFMEPGRKREGLTAGKDMEEAGSHNMHMEHPDHSTANAVKATGALTLEQIMPEITDDIGEDILVTNMANSEENVMKEDVVLYQACPNEPDKALSCDQCEEDLQSEQLLDHRWKHSFTCNICSFTAFSVKDIEDHCVRCEQAHAVPNGKEGEGNGCDEMECEEGKNEDTSLVAQSVPQLTDSSQCETLKESCQAEVRPDKIEPTECDLPNPPDAPNTPVMLSKEGCTVVKADSPSPLQHKDLATECTDNAEAKLSDHGKTKSPRNHGEDHIIAGWKAIVVHPTRGLVRTRTFWQCPVCPYKTDKIQPSIKAHGARHVVSAKFQCDVCTYSCPSEIGLRSHKRMHEKDCDQKSRKKDKSEVQVMSRQLRRRLRKNRRVYRCSSCSFATLVLASFEMHCKKHTRKGKVSRRHTERENIAMIGKCTTTSNDLSNELKDGRVYDTQEANSSESQTNKMVQGQDKEKGDNYLQRELEVLSETSGYSFANQSSSEGNPISPQQRAKTKKYSCIKCSFSCNSWLSVKAHMGVHKKGVTNTAMEIESRTDNKANKLEERGASEKIACMIIDANTAMDRSDNTATEKGDNTSMGKGDNTAMEKGHNTAMEIESCTDREDQENKLEKRDASDKIEHVIADATAAMEKDNNTAMDRESCTDKEEQANTLEERDAVDNITTVIADANTGMNIKSCTNKEQANRLEDINASNKIGSVTADDNTAMEVESCSDKKEQPKRQEDIDASYKIASVIEDANTTMEIESCSDKKEQENKLEERDASDKTTRVIVDAQDSPHTTPPKGRKMYRCTKCPFKCDRIGWLVKHVKHHEISQKYSCDLCSFSTSHKIALINHQVIHYSGSQKGTVGTPQVTASTGGCNKTESNTNIAEKQQLLFRCKECPYTADQVSVLERHEKCHVIWRWHKRLREMSHTGEKAMSEATVASSCNDDTSNSGNPGDVTNQEMKTEEGESKVEEPCKMYTCDDCPFKTNLLCELEGHKTSHGSESKHIGNGSTFASDFKTSELHHGDNKKDHDDRKGNADVIMEDAEKGENESIVSRPAGLSTDIAVQKEDEDKGRQTSLISRPKVDEYKYIFHCEDCPFKTDWFHDLEKHKNGHNNEADFSCDKCSFSAASKGAIEVHRRVHRYKSTNREAKQCTECAFSTHSFKSMQLHMQAHSGSNVPGDVGELVASPLPCNDVQTPSTSGMEVSIFRRKMEEYLYIFNCEQCPFKTDWYHELEKHRMGHNADLEYPCDHCTFSSSTKKAVEVHKRVHKDGSALKTERLATDKPTSKDKQKEMLRRFPHMTPSGLRYYNHKCPKCPFRTDSRKKVEFHLMHHRTKGKYNCDLCTYSSHHQSALGVHRRVHLQGYHKPLGKKMMPVKDTPSCNMKDKTKRLSPQKSHKCTKCPYKTDSRRKMDVHMVFHRKRGKYKCNLCSYSTDRMTTLGPHRRVHLQSQEVSDSSAQDVYKSMEVVQSPLAAYRIEPRSDSGQKYSCNACPSKFNSLMDVRDHVSHHLRQFSYSCPECTYSADSERSVQSHKGVHERHQDKESRPVIKNATQTSNNPVAHYAQDDEMQRESMIKKRKYQCEYCPYATDKLQRSSSHASNHGADHPNKCPLCSYSTSASIEVHLRVHEEHAQGRTKGQKVDTAGNILTVEKVGSARDRWQYKCNQCPYLAKTASYVRSHQRYHSADLPLKCPDCTFSCSRLQQLSFHAEWHGKPPAQEKQQSSLEVKHKPTRRGRIGNLQHKLYEQGVERILIDGKKHYICPHCPFRSRWADQAVAHLEHHFVMYSYKCAHCSYSTRTKDKVKFHMNLHKKVKVASDGNGHSTAGGKRVGRTAQGEKEAASSPSEEGVPKGPRTRARLGVIGQSPIKHTASKLSPTSSSVSRNLGDFSSPSGSESPFIRYMTPSCSKEEPEEGQQVTVLTFVCMYCERPFTDQESWLAHMKRHRL